MEEYKYVVGIDPGRGTGLSLVKPDKKPDGILCYLIFTTVFNDIDSLVRYVSGMNQLLIVVEHPAHHNYRMMIMYQNIVIALRRLIDKQRKKYSIVSVYPSAWKSWEYKTFTKPLFFQTDHERDATAMALFSLMLRCGKPILELKDERVLRNG